MPSQNYLLPEEEKFSSNPINLRGIFLALSEKAWLIALCLIAAVFLTGLWLKHSVKIYTAKAVLQVDNDTPKISPIELVQTDNPNTIDYVKTVEQILQSRTLYERVIDANHLENDPRFVDQDKPKPSKASLISKLGNMLDVRLRPGTRLIDVVAEHPDPALAALVANSLVQQFMNDNKEQQASVSQEASDLLLGHVKRLEQQVRKSEFALQEYKEKMRFLPSPNETDSTVERLKDQLSQAKSERIKLETEYQQFEKSKDNLAALLTIPFIANNPTVMQMKNNVTAKQSEVATIDQRYKAKHYKYIETHSQLAELNNALRQTILDSGQTLRLAFGNAINAEKALQESLDKEQSSAIGLSRVAMDYKALATQAESDRALYQSFLNRMKETSVAKDLGTSKIHIVQNAEVADAPSKPQAARIYLLGAVAGLVIGLALALLLSLTDSSLKSLDEAEEYLRMPTLSTVPQLKSGQLDSTQLVMGQNAVMSGAESFRSLRTSLGLLNNRGDHKIYLFTSAMPEEGKTFCSMNYAYSLAQQGLRVLLIDCDLRRPSIERCLCGTIGQMSGVSDFLNGKQSFKDIVFDTGIPNYYFVPAGTPVGNPSELLAQDRMNALIQEGLNHFDRIVLDSAPIFGVSDTLLMTGRTHVACLVVRACKTPRKKVLRAVQILQNAGAPLVGMILNRLPADGRRNADDPYYDYGYTSERAAKIVPLLPSTNSPSPSQDADKEISASQTT